MADIQSAWGIEIGQAGLKALRLRYAESAGQVVAAAFDYVPHAKLLSQPDAVPDELIRTALDTFLSRNQLGSDLVSIALPGQTALAKFIQLPPVEASRVAAIVKYEAQQQIPFALEEVIWDYQPLGGAMEEGGFMLDAEVGLFAMKREQVQNHLKPYLDRKVEVEVVQIAPLGLFNFMCYDRLGIRVGKERPEIEDYTVVLDMGADNTTLVVTNGKKIWIRNVPLGGNHFTRALTKEMKLTFAKAEHLKCNATKSPDPRAVFQALRPVFNDYVSEIQRSIGYFSSVNRTAKIGRLVGVGNGFKLAGLQKFLQQNLQYEVDRIDNFQGLVGDHVLTAPLFQDNLLTFTVPYGLALQALKLTDIHTTLLPREIAVARKIRRKKPWAVATAATLLFGMGLSAAGYGNVWHSVSVERFGKAEEEAKKLGEEVSGFKGKYSAEEGKNKSLKDSGSQLVAMLPTREQWLEVYKAIDECLPRDTGKQLDETELEKMHRISLDGVTCKRYNELGDWFNKVPEKQRTTYMNPEEAKTPPTGAGYVFTLVGHHYHNEPDKPLVGIGTQYLMEYFLKNFWKDVEERGDPLNPGQATRVDVKRMGISHAVMTYAPPARNVPFWPHGRPGGVRPTMGVMGGAAGMPSDAGSAGYTPDGPGYNPLAGGSSSGTRGSAMPMAGGIRRPGLLTDQDPGSVKPITLKMTQFTVEFAWKPTSPDKRLEIKVETPQTTDSAAVSGAIPPATGVVAPTNGVPANGVSTGAPATTNPGIPVQNSPPPANPVANPPAPAITPQPQ